MAVIRSYWLKFRNWVWDRYSTVRPRYLGHGWVDRDVLLEHVAFEILGKFLENECSDEDEIDWYGDEESKNTMREMRVIWDWWKDYAAGKKDFKFVVDPPEWVFARHGDNCSQMVWKFKNSEHEKAYDKERREYSDYRVSMEKELTAKLIRLIELRRFMWT